MQPKTKLTLNLKRQRKKTCITLNIHYFILLNLYLIPAARVKIARKEKISTLKLKTPQEENAWPTLNRHLISSSELIKIASSCTSNKMAIAREKFQKIKLKQQIKSS